MRHLLWILPLAFLAACAMTPAEVGGAAVATGFTLLQWWDGIYSRGILSDEAWAEGRAYLQSFGASWASIMELVRIWGARTQEAAAAASDSSTWGKVGLGVSGLVLAGAKLMAKGEAKKVNDERDRRRMERNEPVGKSTAGP